MMMMNVRLMGVNMSWGERERHLGGSGGPALSCPIVDGRSLRMNGSGNRTVTSQCCLATSGWSILVAVLMVSLSP